MAPKKKKGKKKKGKKQEEAEPEQKTEYDKMELDMLREVVPMLEQQLAKSELDRNYVQLERDTIQTFYDITRKEVRDLEINIAAKDREMEMMEDHHRVEVRVYQQKVKHLDYEHKNNLKSVLQQSTGLQHEEVESHENREYELKKAKKAMKMELVEREIQNAEEIETMKSGHQKNLEKMRESFMDNLDGLGQRCERRLAQLGEDLELRRKVDIHEIEERKNLHINDLMKNHEKAFGQIKNYYNDITHDNLKLIRSLKDEVAEMKKKASANQKLMYDISQENKVLSEPLAEKVREVADLRAQLKDQQKDQMSLRNARARLVLLESNLRDLREEHKELERSYASVETERNELYDTFESTVRSVQKRSDFTNLVLEQRLAAVDDATARTEGQLQSVVQAAQLDQNELGRVTDALNDMLSTRNGMIGGLQDAVLTNSKAYNDTLRTLSAKMRELGIPNDEINRMGFTLLPTQTSVGPAGLVVNMR